ncbi:MAG: endopeptidase La [Acidobacteriia bacterium]|nr:endopeptidase La [Terriglobia bacterium]
MSEEESIKSLPVLPIKNNVLFPYVLMPLSVGRPASVAAVEAALATEEKELIVLTQRDASVEIPGPDDLFPVGTQAIIKKMARPRGDLIELIAQGTERVVLLKLEQTEPYLKGRIRPLPLPHEKGAEVDALYRAVLELAARAIALANPQASTELGQLLENTGEPLRVVYLIGSMLSLELEKEQALLQAETVLDALRLMHTYLSYEVQVLELRSKIASEAQSEMGKQQREYLLRQQLRAIQQELGEQSPEQAEIDQLRERMEKAQLPEEVRKEVEREINKLEKIPSASPDHNVTRGYLDLVLDLPWHTSSEDILDVVRTRTVLDEDHYDLKEVKERILEQLGVLKLNPAAKAPILCFLGPPGVGKTSLGQSIARAMGRRFERMSLGGLHDEAELRGHRRTYVGALPGRVIQAVRHTGVNNPVLMLDEVDKLGRDFRGDPAAALLEILDPEQNRAFRDNYLDLPFDLSKIFFITTANTLDTIPRALLDRMELLRLPGYSEEEKIQIAERYLIGRQLSQAGLKPEDCMIPEDSLKHIISRYTREAGVRQLERAIGRITRKVALRFAEGKTDPTTVTPDQLDEMLGPEQAYLEQARKELPPGVATGLAWTETGGEVLYVEAALLPKGRELILTGQLGEVMRESAQAARSYIWAHAEELGIDPEQIQGSGLHIHVPAGAVPKDGPSAGTTIVAALASLYTKSPVRSDTAMTGEITLAGLVLPVGGIKEKMLAARRAGIRRIILPRENERNLRDLPEHVRAEMEFVFVDSICVLLKAVIPLLTECPMSSVGVKA